MFSLAHSAHTAFLALACVLLAALPQPVHASSSLPLSLAEEEVRALWASRHLPENVERALLHLEQVTSDSPHDYEAHWRFAAFSYWKAKHGPTAPDARVAERGWEAARTAQRITPGSVEGHFWAAACVGVWSDAVGMAQAARLGLAPKFEHAIEAALRIDALHESGGPLRAQARFLTTVPWPWRDLPQARTLLEKALRHDPNDPTNLYFMADVARRQGHDDESRGYLRQLLDLSNAHPATPHYKVLARQMWAEVG